MKRRLNITMQKDIYEKLSDLSKMFGVPKSVIIERAISYIYDNSLEGEMFAIRKKKKSKEIFSNEGSGKNEETSGDFSLKL